MKRSLKIYFRGLREPKELVLSKVTEVKTEKIYDSYRLIYNPKTNRTNRNF